MSSIYYYWFLISRQSCNCRACQLVKWLHSRLRRHKSWIFLNYLKCVILTSRWISILYPSYRSIREFYFIPIPGKRIIIIIWCSNADIENTSIVFLNSSWHRLHFTQIFHANSFSLFEKDLIYIRFIGIVTCAVSALFPAS